MSSNDSPWLLVSCSLLATTISIIIRPGGRRTFVEDAKHNILSFSPFQSGRVIVGLFYYLIHLRLLNLSGFHTSLKVLSHLFFPSTSSNVGCGFWPCFTRRAFLLGATLPLHLTLLALTNNRWLHAFTSLPVGECVLVELCGFYKNHSDDAFTVRRDWPHRTMLVVNPSATAECPTPDRVDNEGKTNGLGESTGARTPPSAPEDSLCNRIQQLWSTEADSEITFAMHSIPPKHDPKLDRIFSLQIRPSNWTCGHWRCLVNIISYRVQRIIRFSWYIEQASAAWLLHVALHPVTLHVSDKVLENNILGGLLTMFYQISLLLTLFAGGYIGSKLLYARLRQQEQLEKVFRDLAETAPITHKVIQVFGLLIMPGIAGCVAAQRLFPQNPSLTSQMVSYALDIVVVLIVCVTGYRLLVSVARSEHIPVKPEPQSTHQASSDEKERAPKGRSEYLYILPASRFQIFRLSIWALTVVLWIFLHD